MFSHVAVAENDYEFKENKLSLNEEPTEHLQRDTEELLNNAAIDFRQDMGFETEKTIIDEIEKNSNNDSMDRYGLQLSNEELNELDERTELIKKGKEIQKYMRENYQDEFGGMYFNHEEGGILNILMTSPNHDPSLINEIVAIFKFPRDRVDFVRVDHTKEYLYDLQGQISEQYSPSIIYTDIKENHVVISLDEQNQDMELELLNEYDENEIEFVENYVTTKERNQYREPMVAGQQIWVEVLGGYSWCTAGYGAERNGQKVIITAGHCGEDIGASFYQGGSDGLIYLFGQMNTFVYSQSTADAGIIEVINEDYVSNELYGGYEFRESQNRYDAIVGEFTTKSGATTGVTPGVLEVIGASTGSLDDQKWASYYSEGGDSGSPVFEVYQPETGFTEMKGLHVGSIWDGDPEDPDSERLYGMYSHINNVHHELVVDPILN